MNEWKEWFFYSNPIYFIFSQEISISTSFYSHSNKSLQNLYPISIKCVKNANNIVYFTQPYSSKESADICHGHRLAYACAICLINSRLCVEKFISPSFVLMWKKIMWNQKTFSCFLCHLFSKEENGLLRGFGNLFSMPQKKCTF